MRPARASGSPAARTRDGIEETERRARIDLAACYRLVALHDMDDLFSTHISARVPEASDQFLINPFGLLFRQVTASNLVKVDLAGTILDDTEHDINEAGFVIHSAVHAARPDVVCVLHTHTIAGMAVSCLEEGLVPLQQKNMQFHGRIGYHDYEGLADDPAERERLARDLGPHDAMILRNHGLLTCASSVRGAFRAMLNLEKACRVQLAAMATGRKLRVLSGDVLAKASAQFRGEGPPAARAREKARREREWRSLLTWLDDIDPSYRL